MNRLDICSRCKDVIEWDEEIWFPNGKVSCGYCATSEEIDNYLHTDTHKETK